MKLYEPLPWTFRAAKLTGLADRTVSAESRRRPVAGRCRHVTWCGDHDRCAARRSRSTVRTRPRGESTTRALTFLADAGTVVAWNRRYATTRPRCVRPALIAGAPPK